MMNITLNAARAASIVSLRDAQSAAWQSVLCTIKPRPVAPFQWVPIQIYIWQAFGSAWAKNIPIYGLFAKGESVGLMRHMVLWFKGYHELLNEVDLLELAVNMLKAKS